MVARSVLCVVFAYGSEVWQSQSSESKSQQEDRAEHTIATLLLSKFLKPIAQWKSKGTSPRSVPSGRTQSCGRTFTSRRMRSAMTDSLPQSLYRFPQELSAVASAQLSTHQCENCSFVDIPEGPLMYRILESKLFQENLVQPVSRIELHKDSEKSRKSRLDALYRGDFFSVDGDDDDDDDHEPYEMMPGLGWYEFQWKGEPLYLMRHNEFHPVSDHSGEGITIFVRGQGRVDHLLEFVNLKEFKPEDVDKSETEVFTFIPDPRQPHWDRSDPVAGRRLETVLLPASIKDSIDTDISGFLSPGRLAFFREHGIPYKRSYLFYGVPGAGKSSLIRALATKYKRKICILQPSGPNWNDFLLQKAVHTAPSKAMIVLEDVDTLFSQTGENTATSTVSYSGLLNVLDGVSVKEGCIFILTTNFRERLADSLTREGRIDFQIPFSYILPEQVIGMFKQFYPSEEDADKAKLFESALSEELSSERYSKLTPAALQLYFVKQFGKSADEAIQNVGLLSKLKDIREAPSTPSQRFGLGVVDANTEPKLEELFEDW